MSNCIECKEPLEGSFSDHFAGHFDDLGACRKKAVGEDEKRDELAGAIASRDEALREAAQLRQLCEQINKSLRAAENRASQLGEAHKKQSAWVNRLREDLSIMSHDLEKAEFLREASGVMMARARANE